MFVRRKSPLLFLVLFLSFSISEWELLKAQSGNVPATYTGRANCAAKFPGSFKHGLTAECWSCPANAPKRTIWAIDSNWACEKPAETIYRRAKGPRNPTGLIKTDCQKGWFWDIGKGKCYSCEGWKRSTSHVEGPNACFSKRPLVARKATYEGELGCDQGFEHFVSGYCYECPTGSYRNANTGSDPSKFGACTYCGTLNGKPCPVTTLRKSCDPGLVEDFAKGVCVPDNSHEGQVYRKAEEKAAEILPQLGGAMMNALALSDDAELANNLQAGNSEFSSAEQEEAAKNPCGLSAFNTWSLGGVVSAGFILGGSLETGMAVDIRPAARSGEIEQNLAYWYGGASYSIGLSAGWTLGINYGCWTSVNNGILGPFEGGTFDLFGAATFLKDLKDVKEAFKKGGLSLEIGVWFSSEDGSFLGITLTPGWGQGIGLGGYAKGVTGQIPGETSHQAMVGAGGVSEVHSFPRLDGEYLIQNTWKCEDDHEFCDWNLSWSGAAPHPNATVENDDFAWDIKPVSGQKDHYTITNKWKCPDQTWCDAELSWDEGSPHPLATVEKADPTIWKITQDKNGKPGHFLIQSTKTCPNGEWCDANLSWMTSDPPRATVEKDGFSWKIVRK